MMNLKIYENILVSQSGMDYSAGILFQIGLVNMEEEKALTKNDQLGKTNQKQVRRCWCGSISYLRITSNDCPVGISCLKAKNQPLQWVYVYPRQISQKNTQKKRKTQIVCRQSHLKWMKNQMRGYHP